MTDTLADLVPTIPTQVATNPLWVNGTTRTEPQIGDLWVLTTEPDGTGIDITLAMISRVIDDYCLVFPVTFDTEPAHKNTLILDDNPLGVRLYLWPNLDTGIDTRTLGRRIGHALEPDTIRAARRWAEDGTPAPLPQLPTAHDVAHNTNIVFSDLAHIMQYACYLHVTPDGPG